MVKDILEQVKTIATHPTIVSIMIFGNMILQLISMWTQEANYPGGVRGGAIGFSIGSMGYVGTGADSVSVKKDFWEYNPIFDSWTQEADFGGIARGEAVGFSIGTKGYVGTGYNDTTGSIGDFWEYDPTNDIWTQKADFWR